MSDFYYYRPVSKFYRVARATNSWNLSGWQIERYWEQWFCWSKCSRFYWTRRGAERAMRKLND